MGKILFSRRLAKVIEKEEASAASIMAVTTFDFSSIVTASYSFEISHRGR